jgi:phosphatidate cytidylyltransferase
MDTISLILVAVSLGTLTTVTLVGYLLARRPHSGLDTAIVRNFNARIRAWWILAAVLVGAFLLGRVVTVVVFGLISFQALREFITHTPTRRGDHRALFWVFVFFTPLQYVLVGLGNEQYGLYSILIPVYAFLFIPARIAVSGDPKRFLERSAKIQCGLMICVYCLSYAPALLNLDPLPAAPDASAVAEAAADSSSAEDVDRAAQRRSENMRLLLFLVIVTLSSDVLHYILGKWFGRRPVAPQIHASRTWEGFIAGTTAAGLVGAGLAWSVLFNLWQAAGMAALISVMGFAGAMTMSAIKRDRGVRDYGIYIEGQIGILDRIDSLCFAAPIYFHVTRYFFTTLG